jgi:hypothetical protein
MAQFRSNGQTKRRTFWKGNTGPLAGERLLILAVLIQVIFSRMMEVIIATVQGILQETLERKGKEGTEIVECFGATVPR